MSNHTELINLIRNKLNISDKVVVHLEYDNLLDLDTEGYVANNKELTTFIITIHNDLTLEKEIAVIKHEFKHIQQKLEKRLISECGYVWCGEKMEVLDDYYDSPWEVEAREFENS